MKPILFDKSATTFNTNGLGTLDALTCTITEERNGEFELEMSIAETVLHADQIEMTSIILAKVPDKQDKQAFRVYKITKPIDGIFKVYAQHISYQLSFIPTMPFSVTASASACNQTLQGLISNAVESCPFSFATDVTTVASYSQDIPSSIRSRLGGVSGSVLDQFGGEYSWNNYNISLLRNRGVTTPQVTLRYGKNITDLNQEENIADTITGIVPYWVSAEGDEKVTLPEKVIDSQYASLYPFKRTVPYDFSMNFENKPTEAQLRAKAQAYMNARGVGIPKVSIKLSFVNLADTEEYKNIATMQQVKLCDIVGVYFEKLGISTTAKIVKYVYDVLGERYDSLEIGSLRSSLSSTINANSEGIQALDNNTRRMFKEYSSTVGQLVDEATAWLTSGDGYVVATKDASGNWKDILFMDTDDIDTAHNVLRINQNGIGFSSNGVAGPYTQAWTLDGKMVIGGTNAPSITVYDNASPPNILFQINASGMQWDAANSSMDVNGNLTATGATLTNANIVSSNSNRSIQIYEGRITFGNNNAYIDYDTRTISGQNKTVLTIHTDNYFMLENGSYNYLRLQDDSFIMTSGPTGTGNSNPSVTLTLERTSSRAEAILEAKSGQSGTVKTADVKVTKSGTAELYGSDGASVSGGGSGASFGTNLDINSSGNIYINSNGSNKKVYINNDIPIWGVGLIIMESYPSGYDAVDYFVADGTTFYVGINYSNYQCL